MTTQAVLPNIKRFKVSETFKDIEVVLEVNLDVLTPDRAAMINNFYSDSQTRLLDEGNDAVRVAIRLAGSAMIRIMLEQGGATFSPSFRGVFGGHPGALWTADLHSTEGFGGCEADEQPYGWCGIRVIGADVDVPGFFDVELSELPPAKGD